MPLVISGFYNGDNITPQSGGVSHALGWAPDIVPTVLGLAGVQTSNDFAGKTLVPILAENQSQVRGEDEGFGYELGGGRGFRAITSWSLIATATAPTGSSLTCERTLPKRVICERPSQSGLTPCEPHTMRGPRRMAYYRSRPITIKDKRFLLRVCATGPGCY